MTFFSALVSYEWLRSYGPRKPDVHTGQKYPMRMQQPFDVYLTRFQTKWIECGPFIGVGIVFAAGFLNMRWKIVGNPYDDLPKKFY